MCLRLLYNFLAFETIDHGQHGQRSTMTTGVSFTENWQISVLPYGLPRTPQEILGCGWCSELLHNFSQALLSPSSVNSLVTQVTPDDPSSCRVFSCNLECVVGEAFQISYDEGVGGVFCYNPQLIQWCCQMLRSKRAGCAQSCWHSQYHSHWFGSLGSTKPKHKDQKRIKKDSGQWLAKALSTQRLLTFLPADTNLVA